MKFDIFKHQTSMDKAVNKLVHELEKEGIKFWYITENRFENVAFVKGEKRIEMSKHSFYRYSGMMQITRDRGENAPVEIIPVTDEMWLQQFIKPIILKLLSV